MAKIQDQIINLKMNKMRFARDSKKYLKKAASEERKCRRLMEKGDMEQASIYSRESVRSKQQSDKMLAMSYKLENTISAIQSGVAARQVGKSMKSIVSSMEKASEQQDLESLTNIMSRFESETDKQTLQTSYMENAMDSSSSHTAQNDKAMGMMQRIADEQGLDFSAEMDSTGKLKAVTTKKETDTKQADLEERLKML